MKKGSEKHVGLFKEERQAQIFRILETEHRVEVSDLSRRFTVSEDTIRRDLRDLENQDLIRKTHGGALRHVASAPPYHTRVGYLSDVKDAIGKEAALLVEEGDSIIIDSGTTTLCLAQSLRTSNLRVLTNNLEIARVITEHPDYDLIVLGGQWDSVHHELGGAATLEQLSRYRVTKLFLGMTAIDRDNGLTDLSEGDSAIKRGMIQIAQQVIGLADHTKLGKVAFSQVAPASVLDILITDEEADCTAFADLDCKVIKVAVTSHQGAEN